MCSISVCFGRRLILLCFGGVLVKFSLSLQIVLKSRANDLINYTKFDIIPTKSQIRLGLSFRFIWLCCIFPDKTENYKLFWIAERECNKEERKIALFLISSYLRRRELSLFFPSFMSASLCLCRFHLFL